MFGILNFNKPAGITSRDVLNKISRRHRKLKIGHAGTLDPMATGVLVTCVGPATRLISYVQQMPKTYVARFQLGFKSNTEDLEGDVEPVPGCTIVTASSLQEILPQFIGRIQQMPPTFSALRVNGKRAYDLARKGKQVELQPREIEIHSLRLLSFAGQPHPEAQSDAIESQPQSPAVPLAPNKPAPNKPAPNKPAPNKSAPNPGRIRFNRMPDSKLDDPRQVDFEIAIECGSGTYVRSLGRDIALALGSSAVMSSLCRTAIGPFNLDNSINMEELNPNDFSGQLLSPLMAIEGFPKIVVDESNLKRLVVGSTIAQPERPFREDCAAVNEKDQLYAIVHPRNSEELHPKVNFANYWVK